MRTTDDILTLLGQYKPYAADRYGISKIGVFGSAARGEQMEESDVDIYYEGRALSLLTIDMLQSELEKMFGCSVDIVRVHDNMNAVLRGRIMKEGRYVWPWACNECTESSQSVGQYDYWTYRGCEEYEGKIAHHYFEVDAEVVLLTVKEDIPQVKDVVEKMIVELNKK